MKLGLEVDKAPSLAQPVPTSLPTTVIHKKKRMAQKVGSPTGLCADAEPHEANRQLVPEETALRRAFLARCDAIKKGCPRSTDSLEREQR